MGEWHVAEILLARNNFYHNRHVRKCDGMSSLDEVSTPTQTTHASFWHNPVGRRGAQWAGVEHTARHAPPHTICSTQDKVCFKRVVNLGRKKMWRNYSMREPLTSMSILTRLINSKWQPKESSHFYCTVCHIATWLYEACHKITPKFWMARSSQGIQIVICQAMGHGYRMSYPISRHSQGTKASPPAIKSIITALDLIQCPPYNAPYGPITKWGDTYNTIVSCTQLERCTHSWHFNSIPILAPKVRCSKWSYRLLH